MPCSLSWPRNIWSWLPCWRRSSPACCCPAAPTWTTRRRSQGPAHPAAAAVRALQAGRRGARCPAAGGARGPPRPGPAPAPEAAPGPPRGEPGGTVAGPGRGAPPRRPVRVPPGAAGAAVHPPAHGRGGGTAVRQGFSAVRGTGYCGGGAGRRGGDRPGGAGTAEGVAGRADPGRGAGRHPHQGEDLMSSPPPATPLPAGDEPAWLDRVLEAALFAADQPLSLARLAELFEAEERPDTTTLRQALARIGEFYRGRGVQLQEVASGYRFQVVEALAPWVGRLWEERPQRYSRALLETLALIAYRQPVTRGDIEDIRGVAVSTHIMRTLMDREWVRVVGHRDVPGRPAMYATTRRFLDDFNLGNLDELPPLAELRNLDELARELDDVAPAPVQEGQTPAGAEPVHDSGNES